MSYKVLRDGNGSSLIRVIGLGDYMPLKDHQAMVTECEEKSKAIFDIMAENEALAAQVAIVKAAYGDLVGAINNLDDTDTDSEEIIDEMWGQVFSVMQDGWNSFSREPQQCLAEIKAEAIEEFWFAGAGKMTTDEAKEYATKIRNTGTWLKDSNVNGGKRQGGEK